MVGVDIHGIFVSGLCDDPKRETPQYDTRLTSRVLSFKDESFTCVSWWSPVQSRSTERRFGRDEADVDFNVDSSVLIYFGRREVREFKMCPWV